MPEPITPEPITHDVLIIGGGPAGAVAAAYSARAKLSTLVLDKGASAGALGKAGKIESFPGLLEASSGIDLLSTLRRQAQKFGAAFVEGEVVAVDFAGDPKQVNTLGGAFWGRTVIVATGAMGRKPSIEGEADLIGRGVAYCAACDAAFFEGKDVAMVGDLNLAVPELDEVARFARKVYLVTAAGVPSDEQQRAIAALPRVELITGLRLSRILGKEAVEGIEMSDIRGNTSRIEVSGVFLYLLGRLPIVDFLRGALALTEGECIKIDRDDMSTSVPGVFAIGDVTCRRIRQAVLAAADGCIASLSAQAYLSGLKGKG